MTKHLPEKLFQMYCRLWIAQSEKEFDFPTAMKVLDMKNDEKGINLRALSVYLSKIKKAGWMEVRLNPVNSKTRLYKLKHPLKIIEEAGNK
jgi:hypothetical protein